jgi:putative phosphoesterase
VWDELASLGPPLLGVHGNVDDAELRALLPEQRIVAAGGARLAMVHDGGPRAGRPTRLRARFPDCDAVLYGHSHLPEAARDDGVWILNPGSPTERRRSPAHTMLLIEIDGGEIVPRLVEL